MADMRKVPASLLGKELTEILKEWKKDRESQWDSGLFVTKNNRPVAVVVSWERYIALRQIIALGTPHLEAQIKRAEQDIKHGRWMTSEEMKKNLGLQLTEKEEETLKKFQKSAECRRRQRLQRMP